MSRRRTTAATTRSSKVTSPEPTYAFEAGSYFPPPVVAPPPPSLAPAIRFMDHWESTYARLRANVRDNVLDSIDSAVRRASPEATAYCVYDADLIKELRASGYDVEYDRSWTGAYNIWMVKRTWFRRLTSRLDRHFLPALACVMVCITAVGLFAICWSAR